MAHIPANYRALKDSERHARTGAKRTGDADPKEIFTVTVRVRRRSDAPELPTIANSGPSGARERKHLSREEFAAHFGAAQADLDKIAHFAATHGLTVVESSIPRRTVVLKGTAAQMSKAFAVDLGIYETKKEKYRGREGTVHVPTAIADIVQGVFGLDNRQMARSLIVRKADDTPTPAQGTSPLTPPAVASLYGFPTSPNATGQTIGLLEFGGGYLASDITTYFNNLHLTPPALTAVGVDGATNAPGTSGSDEVTLDIDVAGAVAPGAKIAVYFAPWTEKGWVDIVTSAVHDAVNRPSVLSISWGWPEFETFGAVTWSSAAITAVSETFQEAAALGITVFAASGDNGSSCGMTDHKAHVLYPASDPWITACGGTSISNVSGSSFTQKTWTPTGGGVSDFFARPYWQDFENVPASVNDGHKGRTIPDVAGNADPSSGYPLVLGGATTGAFGGTSAVAPLYAGLTALIEASLGEPLGFINPNIYAFSGPYVYSDVNDGASNASNGAPGYKSGAGYDACTGFGSIIGNAMETALIGASKEPGLAVYNGTLYMAWKGIERDDRLFYSTFNGSAWAPQKLIPNIGSSTGPSLAVFNGKLYMAWKGVQADQGIYWTTFDGANWAPQQNVSGVGTSTGPSLTVFNNKLYMAWKGEMGDQRLWYSSFNGAWAPQQMIPGTWSSNGPSIAVFNGALYAAWKGMLGDQRLWFTSFDGSAWKPQQMIPGTFSSVGPTLAAFDNALYATWKGMLGDQRLWFTSFDGSAWKPQQMIPGTFSSVGPGIAVSGGALYAAWKGELGDQRLWFTSFNGSAWKPQQLIPGVGSSPDLDRTAA